MSDLTMAANGQLTVTYGAGGGANAVLPSSATGPASFVTEEQSSLFGGSPLAISPVVQVTMLAARTLSIGEGWVSTFAGSGTAANTDGTGTSAAFNSPRGEAIIGNTLYVLDADAIRAVNMTTGAVSTVVGPASSGSGAYADSANPADVSFETPSSLTSDGRYLYFVDAGNIRRTDPDDGGDHDGVRHGLHQWLWRRKRSLRRRGRQPVRHHRLELLVVWLDQHKLCPPARPGDGGRGPGVPNLGLRNGFLRPESRPTRRESISAQATPSTSSPTPRAPQFQTLSPPLTSPTPVTASPLPAATSTRFPTPAPRSVA